MNIEKKILTSRLLTRSGDQAWDFAIPLVLISLFPQQLRLSFIYFFALKLSTVVLMPYMGKLIDNFNRDSSIKLGIGMQVAGALISALFIFLFQISGSEYFELSWIHVTGYLLLVIFGCISSLGSQVMDIAVSNDLVPSVVPISRLAHFNSNFRKLDLLTEVLSPIIAGGLLLLSPSYLPQLGFYIILIWNLLSFYPEYYLLKSIIDSVEGLNQKIRTTQIHLGLISQFRNGIKNFIHEPIAPVVLAHSFLWVSVLSPHGLLLTAFLKSGWNIPEPLIGVFRALGAVFGLTATFLYPRVHKKFGLTGSGKLFISLQAVTLLIGFGFFLLGDFVSQMLFLFFVLFSRIGLYGFTLSETQLRQVLIAPEVRGRVNGAATAFNHTATLIIYGFGILLSDTQDFKYLVGISVLFICLASFLFSRFKLPIDKSISQ